MSLAVSILASSALVSAGMSGTSSCLMAATGDLTTFVTSTSSSEASIRSIVSGSLALGELKAFITCSAPVLRAENIPPPCELVAFATSGALPGVLAGDLAGVLAGALAGDLAAALGGDLAAAAARSAAGWAMGAGSAVVSVVSGATADTAAGADGVGFAAIHSSAGFFLSSAIPGLALRAWRRRSFRISPEPTASKSRFLHSFWAAR